MKIAIIGAGWVGCHLAKKLIEYCDINLYETKDIFSSASFYNQNRLHLGFHYARSQRTRLLCKDTFDRFCVDYGHIISNVNNNIYAVHDQSIMDFGTYTSIFQNEKIEYEDYHINSLENIQGCIKTKERHISFSKAKDYFKNILSQNIIYKKIDDLEDLSSQYDLVINCTNNFIKNKDIKSLYELTLTLVYKKISSNDLDALTIVDGNFFSIYPYQENFYTLTDAEFTPIKQNENLDLILECQSNLDYNIITDIRSKIVSKVISVYPDFESDFEYHGYFTSIKSKTYSKSADRYPIITANKNIINCFTGKIQGIYVIEDFVKNIVSKG
jgi:hypothetical protein